MHQDFVFNTSGSKSGELRAFVWTVTLNRLDQPDRSNGDEVLHVFAGVVELLEVVDTM
ncbi:hypothetical protein D3C75_623940 [compost metagenome]